MAPTDRGYATVQLPADLGALVASWGTQQGIPLTRHGNPHYGAIIAQRFRVEDQAPAAELVGIPWDHIARAVAENVPLRTPAEVFKAFEKIAKEGFGHGGS